MKTKILLLTLFFLLVNSLSAQDSLAVPQKETCKESKPLIEGLTKLIVYDFASGKFDEKKIQVRRNEPVAIKIKNINPFFYRINVKSNDKTISYQNTDKEELSTVISEVQQMNYYKIQEQYSFEQGIFLSSIESKTSNTNKTNVRNIKQQIVEKDTLTLEQNTIKMKIESLENTMESSKDNNSREITRLQEELLKNQKLQKLKELQISNIIKASEDAEVFKIILSDKILKLNNKYALFEKNAREIIKLNQNYNNYIDKVISSELNYNMYQNILKNQNKDDSKCEIIPQLETTFLLNKKNLNGAYKTFNSYRREYLEILQDLNLFTIFLNFNLESLNDKDVVKLNIMKDIDRMQKSVRNIDEVVQKINLSKKLNQVEILDRLLRKQSTYEYVSAPIQGEEDYLEFDVKIRSKRNMEDTFHVDNDKSFVYKEYIKGGIRFDFSIGTVFDFFTTDKKYTLTDENIVQRMNNNKFNPTIAAMFHASFRTPCNIAYGVSLGTSFGTNFSFNSLFPGFSILFGKKNKFILTAGPSFRSVDELKSNYKEGHKLDSKIADEDLLTKNFRVGAFFGITYNLTQKQQSSMKFAQ
ncbi:hypothetical protein QWT87_08125 [Chryseobacterium sp. APV1]|uniref:Outer membrane protein beta-barrel domain-containing protein n=1 Tax=Chryseobacterium urinae TaxID=3058400 RepID=A0ABT8U450_9FLAO|nr:hypothetical protein [Chryseobacterium sp. APV1]MDO3424855.1 hypothetical protein [Chryseobacterium sp. APV1]